VTIYRGIDGSDPVRGEPVGGEGPAEEERRVTRSAHLASGTLACPECDAPVALTNGPMTPADPLGCPVCDHRSTLRDFLSLATPGRPARVEVRVVERAVTKLLQSRALL
jgi:hypothetical protein